jgi:hypothetical protein
LPDVIVETTTVVVTVEQPAPSPIVVEDFPTLDPQEIANAVEAYLLANPPVVGMKFEQTVALATWLITHSLGREPNVTVYVGGEVVDTDITASPTQVSITFPSPYSGFAILT